MTLHPFVIDATKVVVCFSTPVSSTNSPGGSLVFGYRWIIRTTVIAASVSAKSTIAQAGR